jgi:hypothetical protein
MEDTGASGSGGPPAKQTATDTTWTGNPEGDPAQDPTEEDEPLTRSEAITTFVASSHLPEPGHLMIDHISVLMAVLLPYDGPVKKHAVKLFSMEYDPVAA